MNTLYRIALAGACSVALSGCWHNPPRPSNVTLNEALQDIRKSLNNFRPDGQEPLGIWLTDVEVVLKVEATDESTRSLDVVPPTGKLLGTTLKMSNVDTDTASNTVTIKFKNPFTMAKDTVAADYLPRQAVAAGPDGKPPVKGPILYGEFLPTTLKEMPSLPDRAVEPRPAR